MSTTRITHSREKSLVDLVMIVRYGNDFSVPHSAMILFSYARMRRSWARFQTSGKDLAYNKASIMSSHQKYRCCQENR